MASVSAEHRDSSRTLFVGEARNGQLWKPLDWKKVMAGYIRQG